MVGFGSIEILLLLFFALLLVWAVASLVRANRKAAEKPPEDDPGW
jgi:hypothetical protein